MTNTLYQNIQALGNRMASNLETMGVSASFSDGGLTLADKILQIQHFTNGLLLSADKSVDQSGNTVKLTALLMENGETVSGKRVYFHKSGEVVKYTSYVTPDKNIGESWVIKATASSISNQVTIGSDSYSICFFPASGNIQIWRQGSMVIEKTGGDSYLAYNNGNLYYNGETIDISSYGAPTKVKSVSALSSGGLSVDYGVIGWGTTDDYGVATASYTCTGAGKKEFYAVYGSLVSEPYIVWDTLVYDNATSSSHDDTIWITANSELTRGTDNSTISATDTSSQWKLWLQNSGNYHDAEFVIELDIDSMTSNSYINLNSSIGGASLQFNQHGTGHYKIEIGATTQKYYKDGTQLTTNIPNQVSFGSNKIRIGLMSGTNGSTLTFKGFKKYLL